MRTDLIKIFFLTIITIFCIVAFSIAIAQELESYSNRSSVILSGINCLGQQTFFEGNINSATTALSTAYTIDFFANYDYIVELSDGILSAKF